MTTDMSDKSNDTTLVITSAGVSEQTQHSTYEAYINDLLTDNSIDSTSASHSLTVNVIFILICIIGLMGNSCALLVITKSSIIQITTGVYLAFISVFDNLAIASNLVYRYSTVVNQGSASCKATVALIYSSMTVSIYLILAMNIDRCYVMVFPYKPNPSPMSALVISSVIAGVVTLIYSANSAVIFGLSVIPSTPSHNQSNVFFDQNNATTLWAAKSSAECAPLPEYLDYFMNVFVPVDSVVTCFLVPIVVLVSNIVIVIYLNKNSSVAPVNVGNAPPIQNQSKKVTRMLMLVSMVFIICVLPIGFQFTLFQHLLNDVFDMIDPNNVVFQVLNTLVLFNYACNWFLYLISGKKFRKEAKLVFKSVFRM